MNILHETHAERVIRVKQWAADREKCQRCGYLRINVRHEPDPANAPEGIDYYNAISGQLHPFIPSGKFES